MSIAFLVSSRGQRANPSVQFCKKLNQTWVSIFVKLCRGEKKSETVLTASVLRKKEGKKEIKNTHEVKRNDWTKQNARIFNSFLKLRTTQK